MMHRMSLLLILLLGLGALAGCDDDPTDSGTQPPGTLRLSLTDAPTPIEGVEALHLVLSAVRVNDSADDGEGWYDILPDSLTEEERTVDLLEYSNGETFLIGEELLPAGTYEQIRLVLESEGYEIVAMAEDLDELLTAVEEHQPEVMARQVEFSLDIHDGII